MDGKGPDETRWRGSKQPAMTPTNETVTQFMGTMLDVALSDSHFESGEQKAHSVEVDSRHRELWVHDLTQSGAEYATRLIEEYGREVEAEFGVDMHGDVDINDYGGEKSRQVHVSDVYVTNA